MEMVVVPQWKDHGESSTPDYDWTGTENPAEETNMKANNLVQEGLLYSVGNSISYEFVQFAKLCAHNE